MLGGQGTYLRLASGTMDHLTGVFGTSSTNAWAVGFNGAILHGVR
jgi:hypothetical protein